MKKVVCSWIALFFAFGLYVTAAAQSQSVSLGDYGRDLRKKKPQDTKSPPRIYDSNNLPSADTVNVVGSAPEAVPDVVKPGNDEAERGSDAKPNPDQKKKDAGEIKVGQSTEKRQKAYAEWKNRINKRREKVDQLARELDSLKQNAPMGVVVLHLWPDDQLYLQTIAEKQKALDAAGAELSELQEQARKAGVPSYFSEGESKIRPAQSPEERKKLYADAISQAQARKAGVTSSDPDADTDSKDAAEGSVDFDSHATDKPDQAKKDAAEIKIGQSTEERQKAYADWRDRIEKRGGKIDQLTRELDDLKQNIPTAVILHLWPEDQIYLQIVAEKQKALDQAKTDRSDLQEQARKAGVPSSFRY